jgi:hypothetical protein
LYECIDEVNVVGWIYTFHFYEPVLFFAFFRSENTKSLLVY